MAEGDAMGAQSLAIFSFFGEGGRGADCYDLRLAWAWISEHYIDIAVESHAAEFLWFSALTFRIPNPGPKTTLETPTK